MRKVSKILLIVPVLYIIIIPIYLGSLSASKPVGAIDIIIKDSVDYNFVSERHLRNLIISGQDRILGRPAKEISIADIEKKINILKELKVAEVYLTVNNTLKIYADQRNPVMRVMPAEGGDFFIDEDGVVFRKRNLYNPRLHIVGGNINITAKMLEGLSIFDTSVKNTILRDIYYLVNYINKNSFWSAQLDQIYVDRQDKIDLIPRVGNHVIHLGTIENFEGKLRNLEAFYSKVLPDVGWNKYSLINLEFKDQIVCKRR